MEGRRNDISEEKKERIISEFLPYVKYTASRLAWRLPPQLTVDDLISVGLIGLMEAVDKYDEAKSRLKTYAEFRIRGAMLDELRSVEWLPRSAKKKMVEIKAAVTRLEQELGRTPTDEETASALNMPLETYYRTLQESNGSMAFRFEDFDAGNGENEADILECIPDPNARTPLSIMEEADRKALMAGLIDELPEKEKLLLSLYYWEELTMKEIGRIMHLTEGRVCQLHTQALLRLRGKLDASKDIKEQSVESR